MESFQDVDSKTGASNKNSCAFSYKENCLYEGGAGSPKVGVLRLSEPYISSNFL